MTKCNLWIAASILLSVAKPAFPCTVAGPLPTPATLVERATLIVVARADGLTDEGGTSTNVLASTRKQVRFRVIEVLKGMLADNRLVLNGTIEPGNDPNDHPVPYDFVRPGGRRGNCFAFGYREGGEYLLLLNRPGPASNGANSWSPYWAPLSPTNEQLRDPTDAWLIWVRDQIKQK